MSSRTLAQGLFFFLFEWKIHTYAQKGNTTWCSCGGENCSSILCRIYIEEAPIVWRIPPVVKTGEIQKKCWLCSRIRQYGGTEGHVLHLNLEEIIKAHGEREPCLWLLLLIRYINVRFWMRHLGKQCRQQDFVSGEYKPWQVAIRGRKESNVRKAQNITFLYLRRLCFRCPAWSQRPFRKGRLKWTLGFLSVVTYPACTGLTHFC